LQAETENEVTVISVQTAKKKKKEEEEEEEQEEGKKENKEETVIITHKITFLCIWLSSFCQHNTGKCGQLGTCCVVNY
jgi:hypothetical protein